MNKRKRKLRSQQASIKRNILKSSKNPHCEYCGNNNKQILQIHHIKGIAEGGDNALSNVIILCPNCHKMVHTGQISKLELQALKVNPRKIRTKGEIELHVESLKQIETELINSINRNKKVLDVLQRQNYNEFINKPEYKLPKRREKILKQLYNYINRLELKYNVLLKNYNDLLISHKFLKMNINKNKKFNFYFFNDLFGFKFS